MMMLFDVFSECSWTIVSVDAAGSANTDPEETRTHNIHATK